MASTFFGLTIGTSGLYTAQTGLNVTANNIANELTDGYTRQEITQTEKASIRTYTSAGTLGSGVEVTEITQVRDAYYDEKYWNTNTKLGEATVKENYLTQIENYYDEVNSEGFTTEFSNLFSALEDLSNDPSNLTIRNEVLNYLSSLSDYINNITGELENLSDEVNTEVSNAADTINSLTTQIASLTEQINTIEMASGSTANELRDARALLVDELSEYVPIEVTEKTYDNGKSDYTIKSDGFTLVDTFESNDLVIQADEDGKYYTYIYYDEVSGNATKFAPDSGALSALYEIRDGNNGVASGDDEAVDFKGIEYYLSELQNLKETLADQFNEVHYTGTNLYGDSTDGVDILTVDAAGNLVVNEDLIEDPSLMATSTQSIADGVEDADIVEEWQSIQDGEVINGVSCEEYLESITTEIAMDVSKASNQLENYTNIVETITNQRLSVSGVDTDEETMNLVKYQEAYDLASKVISVMAEVLDKLIQETGV